MRYLLLILLLIPNLALADVYIIHKGTDVYCVTQKNDMEVPAGHEVTQLKNETIESLGLTRPVDEYKFQDKKLKVDTDKVKAKEDKQLETDKAVNERKADRKSGKAKLKAMGLTDNEIDALVGK